MKSKVGDLLCRWQLRARLSLTKQSKVAGRKRGKDFTKDFFFFCNSSDCDQIIDFRRSGLRGSAIYPLRQIS